MATRGRNICNTLKAIRKKIADANSINYSPEKCHFEGECKGTCPKCEQDVRNLEYELHLKEMAGKTIKVAGVALGITALAASATSCATQKGYYNSIPPKPQQAVATDSTENSKIFGAMEEMASFPGGSAACMKYIADNIRAPKECEESDAQGRVILGFTVNEDGSLSDIKVMRSITPYLDEEAIRVVKSMPKWNPAKQNGKPVKSKYTLPVTFCWQ